MLTTRRSLASALLALAICHSVTAQAAQPDSARTGLGDMTVTRQDVPRIARTGLGDMSLTHATVPRVARTARSDTTTRAQRAVAAQMPPRIPWLLIVAPVLLAATAAVHRYRARGRRSAAAR
jgi:hypothetical protein